MGTKKTLSLSIKRALVTGGGGFVGKAIVKRLLELGVETTVLGRHHYPEVEMLGGRCIVGNVSDAEVMDRATDRKSVV